MNDCQIIMLKQELKDGSRVLVLCSSCESLLHVKVQSSHLICPQCDTHINPHRVFEYRVYVELPNVNVIGEMYERGCQRI